MFSHFHYMQIICDQDELHCASRSERARHNAEPPQGTGACGNKWRWGGRGLQLEVEILWVYTLERIVAT